MHAYTCVTSGIKQLHISFEGEVGMLNNDGIRCSIIVHCVYRVWAIGVQ